MNDFRTLMEGDAKGGFTIFYADDGLDTGPILLQKSVDIEPNETVDTLYNRFLYPEGISGMVTIIIIFIFILVIGPLQWEMFVFKLHLTEFPDFEFAIIFLISHAVQILSEFKVLFRVKNLLKNILFWLF